MAKNAFSDELLKKRGKEADVDTVRGEYFRDQTKIIHSQPFRRLKSKTQVFAAPDNDHICTRIEHVLHVATVAVSVCKGLKQYGWELDEELAFAIGLAHDLGHAPFGHEGEAALDAKVRPERFIHEINGYRVVEHLTNYGRGLNLTYAVKDGIICHCGEDFSNNNIKPAAVPNDLEKIKDRKNFPSTYEGCIVRASDKIAYFGRDLEDALRAKIIKFSDIPDNVKNELGENNGEIIQSLVTDLTNTSKDKDYIAFSEEKFAMLRQMYAFNVKYIYQHPALVTSRAKLKDALGKLFDFYLQVFSAYGFRNCPAREKNPAVRKFCNYLGVMKPVYIRENAGAKTIVTDYIAGMTDSFALECIEDALGKKIEVSV